MSKKEKGSIKLSTIMLVIGIVLILVGGVLTIINSKSNSSNQENIDRDNTENNNTEDDEEIIVIDEKDKLLAQTLLSYIPSITLSDNNYSIYQDKEINSKEIDSSVIIASLIPRLNQTECSENNSCDYSVSINELKSKATTMYGLDDINILDKIDGSYFLSCTLSSEKYNCSNSKEEWTGYNYSEYFGIVPNYLYNVDVKELYKVEKNNEYVYVYEKYVNCRFDSIQDGFDNYHNLSNYKFKIYKNSNSDKLLIEDYLNGTDFYDSQKTFSEKIFKYLKKNYTIYKHTFMKNEDNAYSWVKSEPLK